MPNVYYSGDGAQVDFTVTFDYTARSFVEVYVDAIQLIEGTDYDFNSDTVIRFGTAPASGTDNIEIRRNTSTTLLVDWVTGASITEDNLDLADLQLLHIAEERLTETEVNALITAAALDPSVTVSTFMQNVLQQNTEGAVQNALGASVIGALLFNATSGSNALGSMGVTSYEYLGLQLNDDAAEHRAYHGIDALTPAPNLLVNGGFGVWQDLSTYTGATSPANDDDTYIADQWILLSEGNDIVDVDRLQLTDNIPAEADGGVKLTVVSATEKWGLLQILENRISAAHRSDDVVISFYAKSSSAAADLSFKLVSWAGTADAPTTDLVSAWGATGATDPTAITNWTIVAAGSGEDEPDALPNAWTRYEASFTVPFTANNIGVFVYNRSDETAGQSISIANMKLEAGTTASSYIREPYEVSVLRCQRFFVKTFPLETQPTENIASFVDALGSVTYAEGGASYQLWHTWNLPTEMLAVPTVTTYNPHSTGSAWRSLSDTADRAAANIIPGARAVSIGSVADSANLGVFYIHAVADARM